MDIYGDIEAMHGDSSAMSEKEDRLRSMVQQLGSMLEHASSGMQGKGRVALQRAGEDPQTYGTQQATMQLVKHMTGMMQKVTSACTGSSAYSARGQASTNNARISTFSMTA